MQNLLRINYRSGGVDANRLGNDAVELGALGPDVKLRPTVQPKPAARVRTQRGELPIPDHFLVKVETPDAPHALGLRRPSSKRPCYRRTADSVIKSRLL